MDEVSTICKIEQVKQPVLPVPDWAYLFEEWFIIKYIYYLSDSVLALDHRQNSFLLDGGWLDETVSVNSS